MAARVSERGKHMRAYPKRTANKSIYSCNRSPHQKRHPESQVSVFCDQRNSLGSGGCDSPSATIGQIREIRPMTTTLPELDRAHRKVNVVRGLIGIFFIMAVLSFSVYSLISIAKSNRTSGLTAGERKLVGRARDANGDRAARIEPTSLDLSGMKLSAEDIQELASMHELHELNLRKTNINDEGLEQLDGMWRLELLNLS